MSSLPNYLVTFTIFSLPSQTSTMRMVAEAFRRNEDEFCDSCTEELFKNGGCGIFFEDAKRLEDILYFVSDWCTTNCLSSLYTGCLRYCEEGNNPGCDYQSCCTEQPSAVCYTEECINLYGYCCDVGAGTWMEVFRRLPGALPTENPSSWYPAVVPSSDPSNLDDSKGTEILTTLPTLNPTTVTTLMPVSAPTTITTRSPTWTRNATSSTPLAPTLSPATTHTGEPTSSPIFLPILLPTLTPSPMPSYLAPNIKENTTLGVGDFCIANSDCAPMTCVEAIGGVEQAALADDESCSTDTCYCNLASRDLQVEWVLQLCCIEEAHINQTIQPIAESLNVSDSVVRIKSYSLINMPSMRRQMSVGFTWDIIYEVSITEDALALKQELSNENFLDRVETAIEEDIGLPISSLSTLEVAFDVDVNVDEPIVAPTGSDTSIAWALAGAIVGFLLVMGLAYYIFSVKMVAEEATTLEEIPRSGVPIRLGGDRFEL